MKQTGEITKPLQPAFLEQQASSQTAFAEDSAVPIVFGTERFDQGGDFAADAGNSDAGTFTAPVTGRYQLNLHVQFGDIETAYDYYRCSMITSNRSYYSIIDPDGFDSNAVYLPLSLSILADMDSNDTAYCQVTAGGTGGGAGHDVRQESHFSGFLAC